MANMRAVNKHVKAKFPEYDIEVFRGSGYVYFGGDDGFDKVPSLYVHPVSTSTENLSKWCVEQIQDYLLENGLSVE